MPNRAVTNRVIAVLLSAIALAACRVEHDNPPRMLSASYHSMPQELVDRLLQGVPTPRDGKGIECADAMMTDGEVVAYCVCYGPDSCRDLAASDRCEAKIGAVRYDVGVCRIPVVIERIVIG